MERNRIKVPTTKRELEYVKKYGIKAWRRMEAMGARLI